MAYVHPQTAAFLEQLKAMNGPKLEDLPVDQGRMMYEGMAGLVERPAPPIARKEDIQVPGAAGPIPARLYDPRPDDGAARPLFIYIHGGGWVIGSLNTHDSLCATLAAKLGVSVVALDYRLAPEAPFPAFTDDCIAAVRALASGGHGLGHPVSGVLVGGDSAGGNLSAVVTQTLKADVRFLGQLLLYPATDMDATTGSMQEFAEGYLLEAGQMQWFMNHAVPDAADRANAKASPLNGDLTGLPPAVIATCGLDPLRDQGRAYAAALIQAGTRVSYHELAGHVHGCMQFRGAIPAAHDALLALITDLKPLLAGA